MDVVQGYTVDTYTYTNTTKVPGILNMNIVNLTGGSIIINAYIGRARTPTGLNRIIPKGLTLATKESFQYELPIGLDAIVKITTTGAIDYYFTLT